jgi:hypothetical protein
VAVADFNGDGRPDLATANQFEGTVSIVLGRGDGTFAAAPEVRVGGGPVSVAVGDFNGDGHVDLAVANQFGPTVSIRFGQGDGTFVAAPDIVVAFEPNSVAVGDFNGDSHLDLAMAGAKCHDDGCFGASLLIQLGRGDGTFEAAPDIELLDFGRAFSVAVGDFNRDGHADLVTTDAELGGGVWIRLGRGDGTFLAAPDVVDVGANPVSVTVGDFNTDGRQDVATANRGDNTVSILLGRGDGTFQTVLL